MNIDREQEEDLFSEVEVDLMERVEYLKIHLMKKENHNGKKIILIEVEVTTLEVIIMLTLGIIVQEIGKIDLGLREPFLNMEKEDIDPLNVSFLVRRQEVLVKTL